MFACSRTDKNKSEPGCGCRERGRRCPFTLMALGSALFLLGLLLDAEIIRLLWLIGAGLFVLAGLGGLFMMIIRDRD